MSTTYQVKDKGRARFLIVDADGTLRWTETFDACTKFDRLDVAIVTAARVDGLVCSETRA